MRLSDISWVRTHKRQRPYVRAVTLIVGITLMGVLSGFAVSELNSILP